MDTKSASTSLSEPATEPGATTAIARETTSQGIEALKDITFGSIAGIAGKVVEYPFDTVKVRLQSQPDHLPLRYKGPLDCFRQSIQQDGFRGLYRGVSAPFAGAAAETACLFWTYRLAQDFLTTAVYDSSTLREGGQLPLGGLVTAGAMSGGVTSLILTPIELVKCRMQVPLQSTLDPTLNFRNAGLTTGPLSPFAVIADVYRREGLTGFWRGQFGTFLRETGGTAAWFGAYEATTLFFKKRLLQDMRTRDPTSEATESQIDLPVHQQMASGALAGMSYNFIFYPADTIKSKIQTGELSSQGVRPTFTNVGRALLAEPWTEGTLQRLWYHCGTQCSKFSVDIYHYGESEESICIRRYYWFG